MYIRKRKQRISFLLCIALIALMGISTATRADPTVFEGKDPNC